jgi:hypothetical protein
LPVAFRLVQESPDLKGRQGRPEAALKKLSLCLKNSINAARRHRLVEFKYSSIGLGWSTPVLACVRC